MNWAAVLENPWLRDLPFKIELNGFGQILMTPASNKHGRTQSRLVIALDRHQSGGEVIAECSIDTSDGVKVADVVWASDGFIAEHGYTTPYSKAPELCIEIVSPSNSQAELDHKIALYLAQGAREVWVVDEDGGVTMHDASGPIRASRIASDFSFG